MTDALISMVLENLANLAHEDTKLSIGVRKELETIASAFTTIRAVIHDAEKKQIKEKSVRDWLRKVRDVAYDVDDMLDEWRTEALESEIERSFISSTRNTQVRKFISPFLSFNQVEFRGEMGLRIQERLDAIAYERLDFHFEVGNSEGSYAVRDRQTSPLLAQTEILGRIQEKDDLINLLLDEKDQDEAFSVIAIVGKAGLGKTTLARLVYDEERVKSHFELLMWVYVSDDFDVPRLLTAMDEDARGDFWYGKRFLLVLDDVWNEGYAKWEELVLTLREGARGSKIVVTTRSDSVSQIIGANIYRLQVLPEDECWLLFSRMAFQGRSKEESLELEEIGKEIVEKCRGLPLAVKTMGGAMHFKRTKQDWVNAKESEIWNSKDVGRDIFPALLLSYYDLSSHLKQCFAYCSIFPRNYVILKPMLIKMWVAQGFILLGDEMEETASSYFDDLLSRSLFQDPIVTPSDDIIGCKMHDLVYDLAQLVSGNECCIVESGKSVEVPIKARHSSLICNTDLDFFPEAFCNANDLRTIMFIGESNIFGVPQNLFHLSRCLRVLDLQRCQFQQLPSSIGDLKHLRYLDLSGSQIEELPESVCSLCNLMVLGLVDCMQLRKLPKEMGNMISMRHLEIEPTRNLDYLPTGIKRMSDLRVLTFIVGGEGGSKMEEIKSLNLLQRLKIYHLERVANGDYKEAGLKEKKHLHTLELICLGSKSRYMRRDIEECEIERMETVFESLRPHTNLSVLQIWDYIGHQFPSWIGDPVFSNLVRVTLWNCINCQSLPPLGQLPSLKYLIILTTEEVKLMGREFYGSSVVKGFPKLERLTFFSMRNFEEWELRVEEGEMPCLLYLRIFDCKSLKRLPRLPPSLERLEICWCPLLWERCRKGGQDWDNIAHVPNISL